MTKMKRLFCFFLIGCGFYALFHFGRGLVSSSLHQPGHVCFIEDAFLKRQNNVEVEGEGIILKILPEDTQGSRHQRFIIQLPSGRTLLVVHNIDIAPKIKGLKKGELIEFRGMYKWNSKGGLLHWTHHDPSGRHRGGWIKYRNRRYE